MDKSKHFGLPKLLISVLPAVAPFAHADAQTFGKVGAANQDATGAPPSGGIHTLNIGGNIVLRERVRTSTSGSTQILFPDQSSLNVGANSDMVIDEYYYNPSAKTGNMVASATKGALRYIGGQITHTTGATINTPSAVLGVRGGIVTLVLQAPEDLLALEPNLACPHGDLIIAHFGAISVANHVSNVGLHPGYATVVCAPDTPIATPFRVPDAMLHAIMQRLTSRPGQHGGVASIPGPNAVPPPPFGIGFLPDPQPAPGTDPLGYTSVIGAGNAIAGNHSQTTQVIGVIPTYGSE